MTDCFIDTMQATTPAETEAWRFYLSLHRAYWPAARKMFRRSHVGDDPATNLQQYVEETGVTDAVIVAHLEIVLRDLAEEGRTLATRIAEEPKHR